MSDFALHVEGLARLSNGLRTPLALIVGYAELLGIEPDKKTLAEAPQRIKDAAAELTRIVDDLLAVYALDAGVLYLARTAVPVAELVDDTVAAAGARVDVEIDQRVGTAAVSADREQAETMLATLIDNARFRAPNARPKVHVERVSGYARLEVADRGGGLDERDREIAFDAFSRLIPRTGLTTGLELYKVRRLAELHGGRAWAATGPDDEARFGFELPLARSG